MKKTTLHFIFFLLLFITSIFSFSQRGKNGAVTINTANRIVNEYTTLTANAAAGATSITVGSSTLNANARFPGALAAGDLIMIIQMQGATLLGQPDQWTPAIAFPNDVTWGGITNYNNCGNYEFCQVSSVPNGTTINLDCGLIYNYTAAGKVQIVRVPRYSTLTISSPGVLTCQAWNGTTGGVLSVEVQGNTTITAGGKIKTTGTGFRGGNLFNISGNGVTTSLYSCVSADVGTNKGEGIGGYDTDYNVFGGKYCRGAAGNAGGGGNVWNCGGGGGANAGQIAAWTGQGNPDNSIGAYTTAWNLESPGFSASTSSGGGRGGYSFSSSDQNATVLGPGTIGTSNAWGGYGRYNLGGLGGRPLDYSTGKIFLGGGGGAGEEDNNQGGAGGRGGGIIHITCYGNVTGSGSDSIVSDGNVGGSSLNTGSNQGKDGAGGAGSGGTIILNAVGTITGVAVRADGGRGGNQLRNSNQLFYPLNEAEGPGGGGGGGYIAVSNGSLVNQQVNGGMNGTTQASQLSEFPPNGATAGGAGLKNQVITWDTIYARDTSICAGTSVTLSATMYGTVPAGTTILWYNSLTGGTAIASGSTFTTPVLNANTTYYVGFCPGTYRVDVVVTMIAPPNATITQQSSLCVSSPSVNLSAATLGGIWSGNGITNASTGTFDPATAGAGSHIITYTLSTPCAASDTMTINVIAAPDATINPAGPFCENGPAVNLTAATPGGVWSGTGIINGINGTFLPSSAGPGTSVITYSITNPCPSTDTVSIVVIPTNVTINQAGPYCVTGNSTTLTATLAGGTWSGNGITNPSTGAFDPALAGPGTHLITYNITGLCPTMDTMTITVIQAPNAAIAPAGPFCVGASSITLSAATSGGTWTGAGITNSTNGTFDPATAGIGSHTIVYTLYVPCVAQDSITIVVNTNVNPVITQAGPYCLQDPSVNLTTGTPGGIWSGTGITNTGNGTFDPATAGVGTHQIIYTLGGACPGADTISIVVNASTNATITPAGPYCVSNGSITLLAATGGGTWSGTGITNAITGTFDPATAGVGSHVITYNVGGACPGTDTMTIVVSLNSNATISQVGPYCANAASVNLSAATAGGTWTGTGITNGTNGTFDPTAAGVGSHIITYTITGACAATDTVTIVVNAIDTTTIIHSGPYCVNNASVTLTASTIGGIWSGTGITNTSNGSFDPATAGVGSHLISYTTTGACPATDTFTINVIPVANASINPVNAVCINSAAFNLTAANPGGVWSGTGITNTSTGTFDPSVSGVGNFTITYAISGPCGDTATQTVRVNPLPTPNITATNQQGCKTLCTQFNETSASCVNVLYNFGDGNTSTSSSPTHCYSQSGTFNVSITCTDANGCSATTTVNNMITVFPSPGISISPDVTIYIGDTTTLTASGGTTYNWLNSTALSCNNCANPVANPTQTTTYCVEVIDNNGCKDTACVTVTVDEKLCVGEDKWSLANAFSPNNDNVNDEFCLQGWDVDCIEYFHIAIYDRWGEKVYETSNPHFCWDGTYRGKIIDAQVVIYYLDAVSKNKIELNKRGNISIIR